MKKITILLTLTLLASACQKQSVSDVKTSEPANPKKIMLTLTSPAFEPGQSIPKKYTCQADPQVGGTNPPLKFSNIPANTKSLTLILEDPDVPKNLIPSGIFDHWVVFNMSPGMTEITEPGDSEPLGIMGSNTNGKTTYSPPCPPSGQHRYFFRLYALDIVLPLKEGASKQEVLNAMQGHIIEQAELMGTYVKE